jgi:hypothetical protein
MRRGKVQRKWKVIQNDQVVFVTRVAEDRRSPEIIMNEIKGMSSPGCGSGKWKTGMTTELARMTEALRGSPVTIGIWAAGGLGHHVRSRVTETTMPNGGSGGESRLDWAE